MIARLRRSRRFNRGEDGAALVIVLIIVTVVGLVLGAVLTLADTSVRATVALRDQTGSAYNADGAAQAAINKLRNELFNNGTGECFGGSDTLGLRDFYPATRGQQGNAASSASVRCKAEPGTGAQGSPVPISSANKPGTAVLTLGTSAAETGQTYGQSNKPVTIHGGVISNSTIDSNKAQLTVTGSTVRAVGACAGSITPACTSTPVVADPNYAVPLDPPAPPVSLPACNNQTQVAEFRPGLYTDADFLNNCKASWLLFTPGTYFFDFTTGTQRVWTLNKTAVGGTLTGAKTNTPPSLPGACVNPINSATALGVTLAFGGSSQLDFGKGVQAEFCATYRQTSIPTVLYGLKSNVVNGPYTAHAQSGCVVAVNGCDLVSDGSPGTKPTFFFEGFVYAPLASIDIAVNNSTQPYFNFGIVARKLDFTTTGSACTPPACSAFISLPDNSPGFGVASTIVNLTVHVCPGVSTSTCSTIRPALIARVQIWDPTGSPAPPARQISILSWSTIR
jgi:Tfp pilus assembly protein PilX